MRLRSLREWLLGTQPTWLLGPVGSRYVQFVGLVGDIVTEHMLQGMKSSKLRATTFHHSALRYLSNERMMPRYPAETHNGFARRLRGAWDAWRQAGTWVAVVEQLAAYGVTAEVWVQNHRGPLPNLDSGDIWDWDDDTENWSRFFVVITECPWNVLPLWGDADDRWTDSGTTWGTSATVDEISAVRDIIRHWKPGGMVFPHILVDFLSIATDGASAAERPTTGDRYDRVEARSLTGKGAGFHYIDGHGRRAY